MYLPSFPPFFSRPFWGLGRVARCHFVALTSRCRPQSTTQVNVSIFTFTRTPVPGKPWPAPFPLENVDQDVAMFLLARGDCKFGASQRVATLSMRMCAGYSCIWLVFVLVLPSSLRVFFFQYDLDPCMAHAYLFSPSTHLIEFTAPAHPDRNCVGVRPHCTDAYLGYGWQGCQCLPSDTYDGCLPHNLTFEFPALLERDCENPIEAVHPFIG